MRVKICGIHSMDDLRVAAECGADAVGFLAGTVHTDANALSTPDAKRLIAATPVFVDTVVVTYWSNPIQVAGLCEYLQPSVVQIHGGMHPEDVRECRRRLPGIKLIKSVPVTGDRVSVIARAEQYVPYVDAILLDVSAHAAGRYCDWSICREAVNALRCPVLLSGGLTEGTVYDAVRRVRPYGVDVDSGVETDRKKDRDKVYGFIAGARLGDLENRRK